MSKEQFLLFRDTSCAMYARFSPYYKNMPFAEAFSQLLKDFDIRFAADGFATVGQYFFAIMQGDEQIGYFHFSEYPKGSQSAFGWNFHIYEIFQRQGIGTAAAALAKKFLSELGFTKIAINVRADNETAIKIYDRFGFKTVQFSMEAVI